MIDPAEMLEFKRVVPEARFTLPAHPTVEVQLDYFSAYASTAALPLYKRLWHSARVIIVDWTCPLMPDMSTDLSGLTDPEVTTLIIWAGQEVLTYMEGLEALPKAPSAQQ